MTESASTPAPAPKQEFEHMQVWAQALAEVLGQVVGSPVPNDVLGESPADLAPASEADVWILCAFSGGLRGELALRLPAASARVLAQLFMSEPVNADAASTPEHREAAVELLRQVAGHAATALKGTWGEVQLRLDPAPGAPSWPSSSTYWLRAANDATPAGVVEFHLSAALAAALRGAAACTAPAAAATATTAVDPAEASSGAPPTPVNLDLLMNVELAVSLRFGSRRLLLREILDLNPGSVIELDREVDEPVDMLLDGRLVARGEVVVLNGCYGLRITEVA
jgi:flagellar motor switch protein FliN